jgi:hypothetical protein
MSKTLDDMVVLTTKEYAKIADKEGYVHVAKGELDFRYGDTQPVASAVGMSAKKDDQIAVPANTILWGKIQGTLSYANFVKLLVNEV